MSKVRIKLKMTHPPVIASEATKSPLSPLSPLSPQSLIDLRTLNLNNNDHLVDILDKLVKHISSIPDSKNTFRVKQFKKAIDSIQSCPVKIQSGIWAKKNLDGVGDGVAKRIDEILKTGTLSELSIELDPATVAMNNLMTVHGIGTQMAKQLYAQGITTVQMLIDRKDISESMHHDVRVGLKWYNDLNKKIPYDEVAMINTKIMQVLSSLPKFSNLRVTVCGSHRRKKAFSGDIDVLMTELPPVKGIELTEIVKVLTEGGIIVDHLTSDGKKKFMGVCSINGTGRRIDIRLVNHDAYAPALLYFTGSMWVNKQMRIIAMQRGLKLNEYALLRGDLPLPVSSEEDIFKLLGIVYLTPEEREI